MRSQAAVLSSLGVSEAAEGNPSAIKSSLAGEIVREWVVVRCVVEIGREEVASRGGTGFITGGIMIDFCGAVDILCEARGAASFLNKHSFNLERQYRNTFLMRSHRVWNPSFSEEAVVSAEKERKDKAVGSTGGSINNMFNYVFYKS
jgi:hypothetical protein